MNHASLFSGIGCWNLAASWLGWNNVFDVEIDPWCHQVLNKHFPETDKYFDIKEFDAESYKGRIDVLSGSPPCQPFSSAGARKGTDDPRHLWPEMFRVIKECRPRFIVMENVAPAVHIIADQVCTSLEDEGYGVRPFIIPASAVQAPHRRTRLWIVGQLLGHPNGRRCHQQRTSTTKRVQQYGEQGRSSPLSVWSQPPPPECKLCGMANGSSPELHERKRRIKACGNAIVPQVAFMIFTAIELSDGYSIIE